jgi:hypothetical protein
MAPILYDCVVTPNSTGKSGAAWRINKNPEKSRRHPKATRVRSTMIEAQPFTDETLVERIYLLDGGVHHFQARPWRSRNTLHCEFARKFLRTNLGWRIRALSFHLSNSHRETIRIHFSICLFEAASYMVYGL